MTGAAWVTRPRNTAAWALDDWDAMVARMAGDLSRKAVRTPLQAKTDGCCRTRRPAGLPHRQSSGTQCAPRPLLILATSAYPTGWLEYCCCGTDWPGRLHRGDLPERVPARRWP